MVLLLLSLYIEQEIQQLVRAPLPLSERKVGCEIITLQDLHASTIVDFNRVCQVYHGPSNLLRCWFRQEG